METRGTNYRVNTKEKLERLLLKCQIPNPKFQANPKFPMVKIPAANLRVQKIGNSLGLRAWALRYSDGA